MGLWELMTYNMHGVPLFPPGGDALKSGCPSTGVPLFPPGGDALISGCPSTGVPLFPPGGDALISGCPLFPQACLAGLGTALLGLLFL